MASSEAWFVSQRAESLAIILLTEFPVRVTKEADPDRGLDLRVIVDPEKPRLWEFGVAIKGTTHIHQLVDHDKVRPQVVRSAQKLLKGCVFPVALLVFDVATDEGLFGWLLKPEIPAVEARLLEPKTVRLERATKQRIARALSEVRRWYEARPLRTRLDSGPTRSAAKKKLAVKVPRRTIRKFSFDEE